MTGPASTSTEAGGRSGRDRSRSPRGSLASPEWPPTSPRSAPPHSLLAGGAVSWHQASGTWLLAPCTWHQAAFGTGGGRFFLAPENGAVPNRARPHDRTRLPSPGRPAEEESEEAEEESVEKESSMDQMTARVQVGRGHHTRDPPLGSWMTPQVPPTGPGASSSSRVGIKFVHRPGSKS